MKKSPAPAFAKNKKTGSREDVHSLAGRSNKSDRILD
jgi:hypothetical protein